MNVLVNDWVAIILVKGFQYKGRMNVRYRDQNRDVSVDADDVALRAYPKTPAVLSVTMAN